MEERPLWLVGPHLEPVNSGSPGGVLMSAFAPPAGEWRGVGGDGRAAAIVGGAVGSPVH